ncbi:MAG: hypothetical protein JOY81_00410 [Alphaproteobacteria bacterium]|nr:hypothetical protein [Alphaproteobacteria bacterium]
MAEANTEELNAHLATYTAFSKLVAFMIVWLVLLLSSMALGLVGHVPLIGLLMGIGGTFALIVGFAVFG